MMVEVELKICQLTPSPPKEEYWDNCTVIAEAIDILKQKLQNKEIDFVSLTGSRKPREVENFLNYQIGETATGAYGKTKITNLLFTSSYYVGQAIITTTQGKQVHIRLVPDLPEDIRNHLLSYACGVYIPKAAKGAASASQDTSHWLLFLMWRCAFDRALKNASIPKSYIPVSKNLRCFKGRLNITRHLQENLTDQSRFYCDYKPMSMDITINRAIRYVYKLLVNLNNVDRQAFQSLQEHDERLASFGVSNAPVSPEQIDRIVYTRMSEVYRPLMQLTKALIRSYGAHDLEISNDTPSYFVDWTEIWENYLLKVMQKHISGYTFISPNESTNNIKLLDCGRAIRPDFIVEKNGEIIAILDAKYKNYRSINDISRDDLYQMTTYLYHYSCKKNNSVKEIPGVFIAKSESDGNNVTRFSNGVSRIHLCNLSIEGVETVEELQNREKVFCENLKRVLTPLPTNP